ncbi:nitrous oxide reductase accessory protein NosL [Campylobacter geochelonis]|uniref:NosL n=1 Tax=Campylobacter geochelonis TaxID=1780362 RepID=A0A128EEG5_9BACT|nr:nitrous oxide reductase accessory protein NosL [Campylobacter geochelonis]QKF71896.1 NosL domain-containing protein [Campylobacter geochelonis]CZE47319.1 NosL [Campylobacter geochelonis]
MQNRRNFIKKASALMALGVTSNLSFNTSLFAMPMKMDFRAVKKDEMIILQDGDSKDFCQVCGMSLQMFYRTNHAATVDNELHQYCSIHCMFQEAMMKKSTPKEPKAVDNTSLKFINANESFYVYGSSKPATMASVSSYAFATKEEASKFCDEFGGEVLTYAQISEKTEQNLENDIKLIDKRQMMAAKKGEEIYKATCAKIDAKFKSPAQAKAYLIKHKPCGELSQMELSQVAHYLNRR